MDDAYGNMQEKAGPVGTIIGLICSCGCLAGVIAYVVYLGIYAFNNPDPELAFSIGGQCYGTQIAADAAWASLQTAGTVEADAVMLNAHTLFVSWFVWGFWTCVSPCLAIPLFCILGCLGQPTIMMGCGGLFSAGLGCSSLFWIIFGAIWRWGDLAPCTRDAIAPMAADGDIVAYEASVETQIATQGLQVQSGAFMKTWLIIQFCIMGLQLLGCIAGIVFKP